MSVVNRHYLYSQLL